MNCSLISYNHIWYDTYTWLYYKIIKINNWFVNNKLYLNIKKTNHLSFNNFNNNQLDICIVKNVIDQVDYVKFWVSMLIPN